MSASSTFGCLSTGSRVAHVEATMNVNPTPNRQVRQTVFATLCEANFEGDAYDLLRECLYPTCFI